MSKAAPTTSDHAPALDGPLTSAVDGLVVLFETLAPAEREVALRRMHECWLIHQAGEESEAAYLIRSLVRVRDSLGRDDFAAEDYRRVRLVLADDGEELAPLSQIVRHFQSWRMAKEAVQLGEATTTRLIDARFARRRLGKIWRYSEQTLAETLARCVNDLGHIPQVAQYDWWRERQVQLARAQGDDSLHVPSPNVYRKRWKTWEGALLHFGYSPEAIAARAER
ncbi:MAG: hypothetical protein QOD71_794 [Thermoleophilaceae bacterium]|jgi:hypothetical protein|nr:hypothetical protein [Thermoleophilaceae bacterium]